MPRFENEAVKEQKTIAEENEQLKTTLDGQTQAMSNLVSMLFSEEPTPTAVSIEERLAFVEDALNSILLR